MLKLHHVAALLLFALPASAGAGYLDENPDDVFASVYERIGTLPVRAARDPYVWLRLEELKREPCDQQSIGDLALSLDKSGYRREAANGIVKFVQNCGAPVPLLHRSIDIYLRLTDYPKAVEAADEFMRRAPTNREAHYLRGVALEGAGDYQRALVDYADAIELYGADKKGISSRVFMHMAATYAALNRFCEAAAPINMWVALDPATRDTGQTQKIIADYEAKGSCASPSGLQKESFPQRGHDVVTVRAEINGVRGLFLLDTGATYVAMKTAFADRAKVSLAGASDITISTANGPIKAKLTKADKVTLGKLVATNVPAAVEYTDAKSYGPGIDGLLGMSFLSRFEVQIANGSIEVRTRRPKK